MRRPKKIIEKFVKRGLTEKWQKLLQQFEKQRIKCKNFLICKI